MLPSVKNPPRFSLLGPLMGGKHSRAFLGRVHEENDNGKVRTRPVVMVFLPDEVAENRDVLSQVVQETQVASRIDHPNVIGVWGVTRIDEGVARIVNYADGESVRVVAKRAREVGIGVPPLVAAAFAHGACMGVNYAHELGLDAGGVTLVHGGIRPETLMVSFSGRCMVTGYGATTLAEWFRKARAEDADEPYMAPEQAYGGRGATTVATDVYAIGTVLYELLTASAPPGYERPEGQAAFEARLIEKDLVHVPEPLARIVARSLRTKADARFDSPLDMALALKEVGVADIDRVAQFMERLFPIDNATRRARAQLLAGDIDIDPLEAMKPLPDAPEMEVPAWAGTFVTAVHARPTLEDLGITADPSSDAAFAPAGPVFASEPAASPTAQVASPTAQVASPTAQVASASTPPVQVFAPAAPAPVPAVMPVAAQPAAPAPMYAPAPPAKGPPTWAILLGGMFVGVLLLGGGYFLAKSESAAAPAPLPVAVVPPPVVAVPVEPIAPPEVPVPKPEPVVAKPVAAKKKTTSTKRKPKRKAPAKGAFIEIFGPKGSTVYLDGKRRGRLPLKTLGIRAGKHRIEVKQSDGDAKYRTRFSIGKGETATLNVDFQ